MHQMHQRYTRTMSADPIYEPEPEQLLDPDSRGRVSLRALGTPAPHYLARKEHDGTIVLTPAVVLTEAEARLQQRPDILATLEAASAPGAPYSTERPSRRRKG